MKTIFTIIGKSSSGKDTIFKELLKRKNSLNIQEYISYTTRPIREYEKNGVDYNFISDEEFENIIKSGNMLEYRSYNTVHGIWKYGTVLDNQLKTDKNIILILTLEGYLNLKKSKISNDYNIIPIYIEVDDDQRLIRAINREKKEKNPKYKELCRRFITDSEDFSEGNLLKSNITLRFNNNDLKTCLNSIINYIKKYV